MNRNLVLGVVLVLAFPGCVGNESDALAPSNLQNENVQYSGHVMSEDECIDALCFVAASNVTRLAILGESGLDLVAIENHAQEGGSMLWLTAASGGLLPISASGFHGAYWSSDEINDDNTGGAYVLVAGDRSLVALRRYTNQTWYEPMGFLDGKAAYVEHPQVHSWSGDDRTKGKLYLAGADGQFVLVSDFAPDTTFWLTDPLSPWLFFVAEDEHGSGFEGAWRYDTNQTVRFPKISGLGVAPYFVFDGDVYFRDLFGSERSFLQAISIESLDRRNFALGYESWKAWGQFGNDILVEGAQDSRELSLLDPNTGAIEAVAPIERYCDRLDFPQVFPWIIRNCGGDCHVLNTVTLAEVTYSSEAVRFEHCLGDGQFLYADGTPEGNEGRAVFVRSLEL